MLAFKLLRLNKSIHQQPLASRQFCASECKWWIVFCWDSINVPLVLCIVVRTRRNCDVIMTSGSGSDVSDDDDGVIMFSTRTSAPPASNHFFNLRSTTVWYDEVSSMTSLAQFPVLSVFVDQSLSGITCLKLFSLSSLQSDVCFRTVFTLLWLAPFSGSFKTVTSS